MKHEFYGAVPILEHILFVSCCNLLTVSRHTAFVFCALLLGIE